MISIVMPIRNAEKHLEECLNSICDQTFTDWELLAINDHSTDGTENILIEFTDKDSRIQYFNNKGKGIIDALQLAYSKSNGSYITRMDADDIMPENKLFLMYDAIQKNPKALITGYVKYISDNQLYDGYLAYQNWLNNLVDKQCHYKEIYKECVIPSPCWLVSKEIFETIGAFNSEIYPEDYDLSFRFYENNIPIVGIQETLHIWRDHNDRASRNDDNYSNNAFLDLKVNYFLKLDFSSTKKLVLWGAGKKAKNIAKLLIENKIPFVWACNNENKIAHNIYDIILEDTRNCFKNHQECQTIISVANKEEQKEINEFLCKKENIEAFWFC